MSIRPLSVSTRATTSPRVMASPGFFRQATSVPALMSAVRIGIKNSATAHQLAHGADDGRAWGSAASSMCLA